MGKYSQLMLDTGALPSEVMQLSVKLKEKTGPDSKSFPNEFHGTFVTSQWIPCSQLPISRDSVTTKALLAARDTGSNFRLSMS
jgi:hypothetical protein